MTDLHVETNLVLVTGLARAGTTFTINWLEKAWPTPKLWFRESGIPKWGHEILSSLDLNRRDHEFGYHFVADMPGRQTILANIRTLLLQTYEVHGRQKADKYILDKEPNYMPEGHRFYENLIEIFPSIKLIFMLRNPTDTISSMNRREFGRGPHPRPNILNPYAFSSPLIENLQSDMAYEKSHTLALDCRGDWSFQKCCLAYRNAILNMHRTMDPNRWIYLNYESFRQDESVCRLLSRYLGVDLNCPPMFEPRRHNNKFSVDELAQVDELLIETGTLVKYEQLREAANARLTACITNGN